MLFLAGFSISFIIFNFLVQEKGFSKRYFTFSELKIDSKETLACKSIMEANVFAVNLFKDDKKVSSHMSKNPTTNFSLGIDLDGGTMSFITDAAVSVGVAEPDKYKIIDYVPGVNLTAVGYSGASLVTVIVDLKDSTVLVSKAVDFMGLFGSTWLGTCY